MRIKNNACVLHDDASVYEPVVEEKEKSSTAPIRDNYVVVTEQREIVEEKKAPAVVRVPAPSPVRR
jgi:hypothetical protein